MIRTLGPCLTMLVAGLVACVLASAPAAAQDALGSGDALDNNLGTTSGGRNAPAPLPDFRGRNLLITGNVVGGRGFRGTVGYSAENDFRDAIGSDDLFDFRSDSAVSSIEFVNFGRTYTNFRYGQELGLLEFRRSGYGSSAGRIDEKAYMLDPSIDIRMRLEAVTDNATTAARMGKEDRPEVVGMFRLEDTPLIATGSSLGGLKFATQQTWFEMASVGAYDIARINADHAAGEDVSQVFREYTPQFETARDVGARIEPATQSGAEDPGAIDARITGEYQGILTAIADRYDETADESTGDVDPVERARELQEQYEALRKLLGGDNEETDPDAGDDEARDEPDDEEDEGRAPAALLPDLNEQRQIEEQKLETFGVVLRHDGVITSLVGDGRDRFHEVLDDAERLLRGGRYLQAERRFVHAMRFSPNHPLASAGLGHAKLGAGLYLSASLTLQDMLRRFPELIDVKFDGALLPGSARLDLALHTLRLRASEEADQASNGFLMAYIGHQRDDEAVTREGLELMEAGAADDPLLAVLQSVWLPSDSNK